MLRDLYCPKNQPITMKYTFTYIILLLFGLMITQRSLAQTTQNKARIYGIVADSATREPLGLVTLNLKTPKDSLIKVGLSKADGAFAFTNIPTAKYHL